MELAADISNWNGAITAAWVSCAAQNGVRYIMPQSINPPTGYPVGQTREQLQACQDGGVTALTYVWYWPRGDPAVGAAALDLDKGFRVGYRILDCETTPPAGMGFEEIRQEIRDRVTSWQIDIIYTRRQWWVMYTDNWDIVSEFPDIMLHDARWDGSHDFTYWENPDNQYGGFKAPAIKQFGSGNLCGENNIDMNVMNPEVFVPPSTYVGDDYWAKFGPDGNNTLANEYDWSGVAGNLEGIIHQVEQQTTTDDACETKLAAIQAVLNPPPPPAPATAEGEPTP